MDREIPDLYPNVTTTGILDQLDNMFCIPFHFWHIVRPYFFPNFILGVACNNRVAAGWVSLILYCIICDWGFRTSQVDRGTDVDCHKITKRIGPKRLVILCVTRNLNNIKDITHSLQGPQNDPYTSICSIKWVYIQEWYGLTRRSDQYVCMTQELQLDWQCTAHHGGLACSDSVGTMALFILRLFELRIQHCMVMNNT